MTALTVDLSKVRIKIHPGQILSLPGQDMSDAEFYDFCRRNDELRIERDASGNITVMPPTGSETGNRNAELTAEFVLWNRQAQLGHVFDSSTGFKLSNGGERSPDVAWIRRERWEALPAAERRKFARITPDFVLELRSPDQTLGPLREKMTEYVACGCRLGWLIDPQNRCTYVYPEHGTAQTIPFTTALSGGEVLPDFSVRLDDLF